MLYKRDRVIKVLRHFLGTDKEHTVYEAEGIGAAMGLHLLKNLNNRLTSSILLGSDSQALLKALSNQKSHAGHYILDEIHTAAERLHAKQDGIINSRDRAETRRLGHRWKGNTKGVVDLRLMWVPGHVDFEPNERADAEAKKAAQGDSSPAKYLPAFLRKHLPFSSSALQQEYTARLQKRWKRRWKSSPRYLHLKSIDNSAPSKKYLRLVRDLERGQSSLLTQLRTGHIALNQHLFRLRKSESPSCPYCQGITVESVKHYLLDCPKYNAERHTLQGKLRRNSSSLSFLLSSPVAVKPLLKYIHATGRFKSYFADPDKHLTNAQEDANLRANIQGFEEFLRHPPPL